MGIRGDASAGEFSKLFFVCVNFHHRSYSFSMQTQVATVIDYYNKWMGEVVCIFMATLLGFLSELFGLN